MNWLPKVITKKKWRMCATIETSIVSVNRIDPKDNDKEGVLYYYLYENQYGDRKFDVADSFRGDVDLKNIRKADIVYRADEYLTKVKPWLDGRKIPGIASYDKVHHHDLVRTLKEGD